jgi:hypothetical protein
MKYLFPADLPFDVLSVTLFTHLSLIPSLYLIGFVFCFTLVDHGFCSSPHPMTPMSRRLCCPVINPNTQPDGPLRRDDDGCGETALCTPFGPCDTFRSTDMFIPLARLLVQLFVGGIEDVLGGRCVRASFPNRNLPCRRRNSWPIGDSDRSKNTFACYERFVFSLSEWDTSKKMQRA